MLRLHNDAASQSRYALSAGLPHQMHALVPEDGSLGCSDLPAKVADDVIVPEGCPV